VLLPEDNLPKAQGAEINLPNVHGGIVGSGLPEDNVLNAHNGCPRSVLLPDERRSNAHGGVPRSTRLKLELCSAPACCMCVCSIFAEVLWALADAFVLWVRGSDGICLFSNRSPTGFLKMAGQRRLGVGTRGSEVTSSSASERFCSASSLQSSSFFCWTLLLPSCVATQTSNRALPRLLSAVP